MRRFTVSLVRYAIYLVEVTPGNMQPHYEPELNETIVSRSALPFPGVQGAVHDFLYHPEWEPGKTGIEIIEGDES